MNDIQVISECRNVTVAELVDLIGVENTVDVVKHFSGTQVYIPKIQEPCKRIQGFRNL